MDALAVGLVFGLVLFWGTETRVSHLSFFFFLMLAAFWTAAAIFEPLTREQQLRWAILSWWVPFAPWAALRVSWVSGASPRILRDALLESHALATGSIQVRRFLVWWPMVRVDLGPLGRGRLVFHENKYGLFGRLTLRSRSLWRAPWFYGEREPAWPAWTHAMRRHRPVAGGPMWRYWGGSRGRAFVDDRELRHGLEGLREAAILSWPGHLTVAFAWFGSAELRRGNGLGAVSTRADRILDALERIARRWAELSSGTAVPTA